MAHLLSYFYFLSRGQLHKEQEIKVTGIVSVRGGAQPALPLKAVNCSLQKRSPLSLKVLLLDGLILPGRD